jgi:hypothetical protein
MDYEVQRCTRHCAATGRELAPGEAYYSVLFAKGAELERLDYSAESWQGPPDEAVGWWKSRMPDATARRTHGAPNEVMLDFFDQLENQAESRDVRYVLALLLVRRRVMRLEDSPLDPQGNEWLVLYCPRRDATYKIPAVVPGEERIQQIQDDLARLLQ